MPYGGTVAPSGWLFCDGSAVSRATYAELFNAIGTSFGPGDGSTTFDLPDMRGRVPVGAGTGTGGGASGTGAPTGGSALTARAHGAWAGAETVTLALTDIPDHAHQPGNGGMGTAGVSSTTDIAARAPVGGADANFRTSASIYASGTYGSAVRGAQTGHANIQPFVATNFIIRWDGSVRTVSSNSVSNVRIVTASSYNVTDSDCVLLANTTSNAITLVLPAAHSAGRIYEIKDYAGTAATNNITIDPADADTIDGASSVVMNVPREFIRVISDGNNWHIM